MNSQLRSALERLDMSIDNLATVAEEQAKRRGKGNLQSGARNRAEVLGRLDTVIERVEHFLSKAPLGHAGA